MSEGVRRRRLVGDGRRPALTPDELGIQHDVVNECVVIAAACVDPVIRHRLVTRYSPDYLYGKGHAVIWEALRELDRKNLEFSVETLIALSSGQVDGEYLRRVVSDREEAPPNISHHASILEWDRARVEAARGPVTAFLQAIKNPATDPERVRALARAVASSFEHAGDLGLLHDAGEIAREAKADASKRAAGLACYPFGIPGLDFERGDDGQLNWRMVPGAEPGLMTVLTALTGGGKSTVANWMILAQSGFLPRQFLDEYPFELPRRRVLVGAWEMPGSISLELLACMSLGWSRKAVMTGGIGPDHMRRYHQRIDELAEYIRFMKRPRPRTQAEARSNQFALDAIEQHIEGTGADFAVFDLWKRAMAATDPDDEERALTEQQDIAKRTRCHCLLLQQQVLKKVEERQDKRPTREGIKGSGAWSETPDTSIGVHMPGLWSSSMNTTIELIVLKQRYGAWPQAVEFDYEPDTAILSNGRTVPYNQPSAAKNSGGDELTMFTNSGRSGRHRRGGRG